MLDDLTVKDKLNKRMEKKLLNIKFNDILNKADIDLSNDYLDRIQDCGTFLEFLSNKELDKYKLSGANFCGNRFCPHCSFNKARKDALEFSILLKYIKDNFNYNFIFLTLTAPNVLDVDLNNELISFSNAFNRLIKYKQVNTVVKGYIRKLELTYNKDTNTYHPHYHVIIAVNKSYFTDTKLYLSQKDWLKFWQKSKRDNTITQVDVRKIKDYSFTNAVIELAKYISKDSDYLYNTKVFKVFYNNLKNKRYYSFNGVFKLAHKLYKYNKLDIYKEVDDIEYIYKVYYIWRNSNYSLDKILELSDEEKDKYNFNLNEELEID